METRQGREGGVHQPRDGRLEPPEAGTGGEDPPLETLQGAQPWDTLTSDVLPPGLEMHTFSLQIQGHFGEAKVPHQEPSISAINS